MDLSPAFALFPWNPSDIRHLTNAGHDAEFACERVTADDPRGVAPEGSPPAATILEFEVSMGLPPASMNWVWLSDAWAKCGCGGSGDPKKPCKPAATCLFKQYDLPANAYACKFYPPVLAPHRVTDEEDQIVSLRYERYLLTQPGDLLRQCVRDLRGKALLCWASQTAHAKVLIRYMNSFIYYDVKPRPPPRGILDEFYKRANPPQLHCKQCKKYRLVAGTLEYDERADVISWRCSECQGNPTNIKKIIKSF